MQLRSDECPPRPWMMAAMVLAPAGLAFVFGWPTRHGDFLLGDDRNLVLNHVLVNHPSWRHAWELLTSVHGDLFQPLPMLSFQLNFLLSGGDPFGYHLTNILLHVANAALVSLLAYELTRCRRVAGLTAAMFACHPLAIEAVAWINGRMILLATLFTLLALLAFVRRRPDARGAFAPATLASSAASLLCKVLPTLPLAAAWCDAWSRPRTDGPLGRNRRWWTVFLATVALTAAATWFAWHTTRRTGITEVMAADAQTPAPVRLVLAARAYLENYVWPVNLTVWQPAPRDAGYLSAPVGVGLLEWAALGGLVWLGRRGCPAAWRGVVLFVILLAPFLALVNVRGVVATHRYMYLPMIGLHLATAAAGVALLNWARRFARPAPSRAAAAAGAVALLAFWLHHGRAQAALWLDNVTPARRSVEAYPDEPYPRVELARVLTHENDPAGALAVIDEARRRWPDDPRLAMEAGEACRALGRFADAEREFRVVVARVPEHLSARYLLGLNLERLGRHEEARTTWSDILAQRGDFVPAATALARSLKNAGRLADALAAYDRALRGNPYHVDALFESAVLLYWIGRFDESAARYRAVLDVEPEHRSAQVNLAACLTELGRLDEAAAMYDALLANPAAAVAARLGRAGVRERQGRPGEAESDYRAVLAVQPAHRDAAVRLHLLLQSQRRFTDLVELWRNRAAASSPDGEAAGWLDWSQALSADRAPNPVPEMTANTDPGRCLRAFAALLRAPDPGRFDAILALPRCDDAAAADALRAVRAGLADRGERDPGDMAVRCALAAVLWLQRDDGLCRRVVDQIVVDGVPEPWRPVIESVQHRLGPPLPP